MGEHFLYLTTTGRKSGEPRSIEIWFVERDGCHYVVSERREQSQWVKNIQHNPAVTFSVGTRGNRQAMRPEVHARARVISPDGEPALAAAVRALMDAKYRWSEGLIVEFKPE
jgi:deazaflavin-dependent oxidoreductase (nitroreductase family)